MYVHDTKQATDTANQTETMEETGTLPTGKAYANLCLSLTVNVHEHAMGQATDVATQTEALEETGSLPTGKASATTYTNLTDNHCTWYMNMIHDKPQMLPPRRRRWRQVLSPQVRHNADHIFYYIYYAVYCTA